MLNKKTILTSVLYSALVIAFKLQVFLNQAQQSMLWRFSHVLSLLMILPFVVFAIFLVRKENSGILSGKLAMKEGFVFLCVSVIILSIFNFIFDTMLAKVPSGIAFKDTTLKLMGMLMYGIFSSFIGAVLLKRN